MDRGLRVDLLEALSARTWTVLGWRLNALSLWQWAVLQREGFSVLCEGGGHFAPGDLVRAVGICRLRYPVAEVRGRFSFRAFWCFLGGGFYREVEAFRGYLAESQMGPEYSVVPPRFSGSAESRTPAPETLRMVRAVMGCTGCSRSEAWDCSIGEARWWYALWLQERGADLDFVSAQVRAEQEQLERENPELHAALVRGAGRVRRRG